jgi:NAD(P) transhydrogenase subunit alpha
MKIGVLKPNDSRDLRSTIHPETIGKLSNIEALNISFEHGVGAGMSISDDVFAALRANPQTRLEIIQQSDFIFIQDILSNEELSSLKSGTTLVGIVSPFSNKEFIQGCASKKINLVSMEFVPRITRAQKMDVLSSQANLAGYVAVLSASSHFHSALPMMMTAAGTLKPAKVFIIGVGLLDYKLLQLQKDLVQK